MALQITPSEREALQLLANGSTTDDVAGGGIIADTQFQFSAALDPGLRDLPENRRLQLQ
jgi:hypothetical protein